MVVNNYFVAASPISWEGLTLKFSSMFVQHMQEVENMPIPPVYVYIYTYNTPIASMYGIFTYTYTIKNERHVSKYTSPMDCMGTVIVTNLLDSNFGLRCKI